MGSPEAVLSKMRFMEIFLPCQFSPMAFYGSYLFLNTKKTALFLYDYIFPWSGLSACSSSWCSWSCSSSSTPTTRRWWARSRPSTPRSFPLPCRRPRLGTPPGKVNRIAVEKTLGSKLWWSSAQILELADVTLYRPEPQWQPCLNCCQQGHQAQQHRRHPPVAICLSWTHGTLLSFPMSLTSHPWCRIVLEKKSVWLINKW